MTGGSPVTAWRGRGRRRGVAPLWNEGAAGAPTEGGHATASGVDGKHPAAAEAVVGLAVVVVGLDGEPGLDDLVDRHVFSFEVRQQPVARIRCEAQAEIVDGRVLEAAAAQV